LRRFFLSSLDTFLFIEKNLQKKKEVAIMGFEDIYTSEFRELQVENDEISAFEEGFMQGYEAAA